MYVPMMENVMQIETVLATDEIVKEIGQGTFCNVYEGYDLKRQRRVAMKVSHFALPSSFRKRRLHSL